MAGPWYALECILVPAAIGAVMYLAFDVWDRRRRRSKPDGGLPWIDYFI